VRGWGIVLGTAAVAWLLLAGPAAMLGGTGPEVTVPALLVCLVPNLLALGVAGLVRRKSPTAQTGVLLASFLVRPLLAMGLGLAAYYGLPDLRGRGLALLVWGAVFYLLILAAESYVVSRQVAGSTAGR
jgi:hypothetical protein